MRTITINQPKKLVISENSLGLLIEDIRGFGIKSLLLLIDPHLSATVSKVFAVLESEINILICESSGAEPYFSDCEKVLEKARKFQADAVVGIGGGSVLDLAKLVAALAERSKPISSFVGNGLIVNRSIPLFCVPTTSGAGSEASPNAILIDDTNNAKKGIIDTVLIPDAVYIDPTLLVSLPPAITAYTGLDALTHCIEAYANKHAHPVVDVYALEGIKLISQNLGKVIRQGDDMEARANVALGAYYGGICLGPVNTAAVHALAYPLGTTYKIAHGLSNALLLPFVLEFNLDSAEERYARIALAMGGKELGSRRDTALQAISLIRQLIAECGMPARLSDLEVKKDSVTDMAKDAMEIQRLLKNNVREVLLQDAVSIYESAF